MASGATMPIVAFLITGGLLLLLLLPLPKLLLTHVLDYGLASGVTRPIVAFLRTDGILLLLPTTATTGCVGIEVNMPAVSNLPVVEPCPHPSPLTIHIAPLLICRSLRARIHMH